MLDFLIRFDWSPFHGLLNFKNLYALTVGHLSSFKNVKNNYSFSSVLVGVIFSQVSPGIYLQVADLIRWYQVTIRF